MSWTYIVLDRGENGNINASLKIMIGGGRNSNLSNFVYKGKPDGAEKIQSNHLLLLILRQIVIIYHGRFFQISN